MVIPSFKCVLPLHGVRHCYPDHQRYSIGSIPFSISFSIQSAEPVCSMLYLLVDTALFTRCYLEHSKRYRHFTLIRISKSYHIVVPSFTLATAGHGMGHQAYRESQVYWGMHACSAKVTTRSPSIHILGDMRNLIFAIAKDLISYWIFKADTTSWASQML